MSDSKKKVGRPRIDLSEEKFTAWDQLSNIMVCSDGSIRNTKTKKL